MLQRFLATSPRRRTFADAFPLPLDQPFTAAEAVAVGLHSTELSRLCREGHLRRLVKGVYVGAETPDTLDVRVAALRLVVPPNAVVTDRTAGWLLGGKRILGPNDHLETPPVSAFVNQRGHRLRNGLAASGQRLMPSRHVMTIDGLRVTTPLRTACDLGRLLHRDWALAALDIMLRLGVNPLELREEIAFFRGMRGVRQLRELVPLADPRAESPGESITRLRWLDLDTEPTPEPQVEVPLPWGSSYWLDLGVRSLRFAVEYNGEEYHDRTDDQRSRDLRRYKYLEQAEGWLIRPVTRHNVFGHHRDIEAIILSGMRDAAARGS